MPEVIEKNEAHISANNPNLLRKHTAVVHISNTIGMIARKIYNVLLQNVSSSEAEKESHFIEISAIKKSIGYESTRDYEFVKEAVLTLLKTSVTFNILGKDRKNDWTLAMNLLSQVEIVDGTIRYVLPPEIRRSIQSPNIYTTLNLDVQRVIKSKYSLSLWEFCSEQLDSSKKDSVSATLRLQELRELLGANEDTHMVFKVFNQRVVKLAIEEINDKTGLKVSATTVRDKRSVAGVNFLIERVESKQASIISKQSSIFGATDNIISVIDDLARSQDLIFKGIEVGVPEKTTMKFIARYEYEKIQMVFDYMSEAKKKSTKILCGVAYATTLLKNDISELNQVSMEEPKCSKTKELQLEESQYIKDGMSADEKTFFRRAKEEFGIGYFKAWIMQLKLAEIEEKRVVLIAKTLFIGNWVITNYSKRILQIWKEIRPSIEEISIIVQDKEVKAANDSR